MANCNYCGNPLTGKDGELELFASGESVGVYCSFVCWTKAIKHLILETLLTEKKCGRCTHIQKWERGSKFFFIAESENQKRLKTAY